MKNLIILCCVIVVGVYFYYPVFDSKGISYIILFFCFVVVCVAGAKLSSDGKEDYDSVEKKMDELHNLDGMFRYTQDGFYIKKDKSLELIKWAEIITVSSLRIPVLNDEQTGIEIITEKKSYEFIDQYTPGIEKLIDKLYENLSNWEDLNSEVNNLRFQKTKLFERDKSIS